MNQRREKRFRQLERRVATLEVQVKDSHQEKMMQDISAAVQRSCVDAHWEPAADTAPARRGLLQRIKRAWKGLTS